MFILVWVWYFNFRCYFPVGKQFSLLWHNVYPWYFFSDDVKLWTFPAVLLPFIVIECHCNLNISSLFKIFFLPLVTILSWNLFISGFLIAGFMNPRQECNLFRLYLAISLTSFLFEFSFFLYMFCSIIVVFFAVVCVIADGTDNFLASSPPRSVSQIGKCWRLTYSRVLFLFN